MAFPHRRGGAAAQIGPVRIAYSPDDTHATPRTERSVRGVPISEGVGSRRREHRTTSEGRFGPSRSTEGHRQVRRAEADNTPAASDLLRSRKPDAAPHKDRDITRRTTATANNRTRCRGPIASPRNDTDATHRTTTTAESRTRRRELPILRRNRHRPFVTQNRSVLRPPTTDAPPPRSQRPAPEALQPIRKGLSTRRWTALVS